MSKRVERAKTEQEMAAVAAGKFRFYRVLYHINEGFEQILAQLQQLDERNVSQQISKYLRVIVEETRAQVNFELVELLQERELSDWTRFGRLRQENEPRLAERLEPQKNPDSPRNRSARRLVQRKHQNK